MQVSEMPLAKEADLNKLPEGQYRIGEPEPGEVFDIVRCLMHRGPVQNCVAIRDGRGKELPRGVDITIRPDGFQIIRYQMPIGE